MIRPMTSEDIADIQQIVYATWRKTYDNIIPQELQNHFLHRNYSDMMLMKRMEKTIMLVAECDGKPIGFANFTKTDTDGDSELTAMYISPSYQQTGYGNKLLQTALTQLADATQLFVYVNEQNLPGCAFYEKQGFQATEVFDETFEGHPVKTVQYVYKFPSTIL